MISTQTALQVNRLAQDTGALIMQRLAAPETLGVKTKSDKSQVTNADFAADEKIKQRLHALTPDIPILSEEDTPEAQRKAMAGGTYWCVDPLDGTSSAIKYANGNKDSSFFGVLIGLVKDGKPVFGVAHYPVLEGGITYFTNDQGTKAYRQKNGESPTQIFAKPHTPGEPPTIATNGITALGLTTLSGQPVSTVTGLAGSRVLAAAEGKVNAGYYGFQGHHYGYWDMASLHAILKASGGDLVGLPPNCADHVAKDAFAQSKPLEYTLPPEGQEPYFSHCIAGHTSVLEHLGVSPKALGTGNEIT